MKLATLISTLSIFALSSLHPVYASGPLIRTGTASVCPSDTTGSTASSAESLTAIATILIGVAAKALGNVIDNVATKLTTDEALTLKGTAPINSLLSYDATDKSTKFSAGVKCVWVAVSDNFGEPYVDENANFIPGRIAPDLSARVDQLIPFSIDGNKEMLAWITGLKDKPLRFYFEAKVSSSSDYSAWRLIPRKFYYPDFLAKSSWRQADEHDFLLALQFSKPGADGAPFSVFTWSFDALEKNSLTVENLTSGIFSPAPNSTAPTTSKGFFPVNLTAMITETKKPTSLSKTVGGILSSQKTAIVNEFTDKASYALLEEYRQTSYTAADTAAGAALVKYNAAYAAAKAAETAYLTAKAANDVAATILAKNNLVMALVVLKAEEANTQNMFNAANQPFTPAPAISVS